MGEIAQELPGRFLISCPHSGEPLPPLNLAGLIKLVEAAVERQDRTHGMLSTPMVGVSRFVFRLSIPTINEACLSKDVTYRPAWNGTRGTIISADKDAES
jgi:hypothetical protein